MITKKDLRDAIDEATADIISAVTKGFETVASKDELKEVEKKVDILSEKIDIVKSEVKDVKRSINDLKADTPTPQEFAKHEKRIGKLETAVFPQ